MFLKNLRKLPAAFLVKQLTLEAPDPHGGQIHSNNLLAAANELFECVQPFCGVGT